MATVREIKHRIGSVRSTQQITRAMKMVAAAKLRRAQERLAAVRPYAADLGELACMVTRHLDFPDFPFLRPAEPSATAVLVFFTSDRGLCGSFNSNLVRFARQRMDDILAEGRKVKLLAVGRKGAAFFHSHLARSKTPGVELRVIDGLYDTAGMAGFVRMASELERDCAEGRVGSVETIFSLFHSVIKQTPVRRLLVPLDEEEVLEGAGDEAASNVPGMEPLAEPDAAAVASAILRRFVAVGLYRALVENWASEMGARMTAMDTATNNADELITALTLEYNKARQAEITSQIVDIAGGAEALKQG